MIGIPLALGGILLYIAILFLIARWGESKSPLAQKLTHHPVTFSLSMTIFCTSWTFYGMVGSAATTGFLYMTAYLSIAVAMIFSWSFYRRLIKIKTRYRITNIVDFIVARYSRSNTLGIIASFFILFGVVPYISIQLKVIIETFYLLIDSNPLAPETMESTQHLHYFEWLVIAGLVLFTIIFGVRKVDPTERHKGIMLAISFEGLVKVIALCSVGIYVCWGLYDGLDSLLLKANEGEEIFQALNNLPAIDFCMAFFILSISSFLFLPRQFHVAVVENHDTNHIRTAQWLVPLYMLLITMFVIPIAIAGLMHGFPQFDSFVILLPIANEAHWLSFLAYLGGFSAAMGMIAVSAMTVSTMFTNNLILPIVEHFNICTVLRQHILTMRWALVSLLIVVSYIFYKVIAAPQMMVQIGIVSFVATLPLAPIILGGLYWRNGSKTGAITGLCAGFITWFITMVIPMFVQSGWLPAQLLQNGLFGLTLFKPLSLLGTGGLHPLAHATFWTLFATSSFYIVYSRRYPASKHETLRANDFIHILEDDVIHLHQEASIELAPKLQQIEKLLRLYFSPARTKRKLDDIFSELSLGNTTQISPQQLAQLIHAVESAMAGSIGIASAHKAVRNANLITQEEQQALSATYADVIARLNISPQQLKEKVDYYQEREVLLAHNAEELQHQVEQRTTELKVTNDHLLSTLSHLKDTQAQLVEADKMAALGGLVAGVAHEINTPLGISITAASHLQDSTLNLLKKFETGKLTKSDFNQFFETNTESLQILLSNTNKAAELVRSFKQVAVDRSSADIRDFDMAEYVHEVMLSLKPKLKHTQHSVDVDCPDGLIAVTYPGAISQVLTNLVMNSLIHGFADDMEGHMSIRIREQDNHISLIYQDNGKGMTAEVLEHLFEPFYTTRRGDGGSGLGAHIVYNLITQKLKGTIKCESQPDQGTTFIIEFPKVLKKT